MSSLFKKLSTIDDITKDTVNGWIRNQQQSLNLCHIPMMLCSICILYYHNDEIFDTIGKDVKVSKDKKCITKVSNGHFRNKSYGINQILLNDSFTGKYQWDIKIIYPYTILANFTIGLSSERGLQFKYCDDGNLRVGTNEWKEYGARFHNDDIVSILLDLHKMEIRFFVNGKDQGKAYNVTASDEKLRLSVTMYFRKSSVEIIKFSKQK